MKKIAFITCLFYLQFIAVNSSFSQEKTYQFDRINASTGLKNEGASDFLKDNKGFMWIATFNGLYKYDGNKCKYYNLLSEKQPFQFSVEITCMIKLKDGSFIIGTRNNGLYRFDPEVEKTQFCTDAEADKFLFSTTINSILAVKDSIYIGTDAGLYKSSADCRNLKKCGNISIKINKIYQSADDSIWLATHDSGLCLLDAGKNKLQQFVLDKHYGPNRKVMMTIIEWDNKTLFLGTWDNGLISFNRKTRQFKQIKNYNRFNTCLVKDLALDKAGNLWVATYAEGLCRYSIARQTFTFFKSNPDLTTTISNNTILRLYKDDTGVLWIGTWGGYVCTLDLNAPPVQTLGKDVSDKISNVTKDISSIFQEPDGTLWISSYTDGLVEVSMDKNSFRAYNVPVISNSAINTISRTAEGTIWVGSCNGLNKISADRKKIAIINMPNAANDPSANSIYSIYADGSDNLWIGSNNGRVYLYNYKQNTFETYEGNINPGSISNLYVDKNNVTWIAGSNGLFKIDRDQKKIVNSDFYQSKNIPFSIRRILPLSNGNLLLGTANNGLLEYSRNNNSFSHLINYLELGTIYDMRFDSCSILWMATSNGLFSYSYPLKKWEEHTYQQGIKKTEFFSVVPLRNGLLAVGGKGLNFFNPYYKKSEHIKPAVVFTDLLVMDKKIESGDSLHGRVLLYKSISTTPKIELKYDENIFTLYFASLDYTNPRIIEYRYKLEGFDKEWHYTDATKAFATYTNLNDGIYTMVVEATNANKQWIANPAHMTIQIIPPFWRTIWFRLSIALVFLWLIYSFYKQKLAIKQKEVERLKNEKLQAEIKNKEEILTIKNAELTSSVVHISNKNEVLQEIRRGLRTIKYASNPNEISKTINKINAQINQNFSTDNHWEQFEMHFNQLNHNFIGKLKREYPDLTQNNLQLCAYLRMNLGSKEIASLMNISPNAVLKSKYRLKLKFRLSKDQDLIDFILKY